LGRAILNTNLFGLQSSRATENESGFFSSCFDLRANRKTESPDKAGGSLSACRAERSISTQYLSPSDELTEIHIEIFLLNY
jgi:hypothetical protein